MAEDKIGSDEQPVTSNHNTQNMVDHVHISDSDILSQAKMSNFSEERDSSHRAADNPSWERSKLNNFRLLVDDKDYYLVPEDRIQSQICLLPADQWYIQHFVQKNSTFSAEWVSWSRKHNLQGGAEQNADAGSYATENLSALLPNYFSLCHDVYGFLEL